MLAAVRGITDDLLNHFQLFFSRVTDALKNPFTAPVKLIDALLMLVTGTVGIILRTPIVAFRDTVLQEMRRFKVHNRLMTFESAVRLAFDSMSKWVNVVTFTDESGLIAVIAQSLGRFTWRLRSRIKFLRLLITATSEAEIIQGMVASFQRKIVLFRWVGLVLGALALLGLLGSIALWGGLAFLIADRTDSQLGFLVPNNRRRTARGKHQHRTKS